MQVAIRYIKWCWLLSVFLVQASYAQSSLRLITSDPLNSADNVTRVGAVASLTFSANLNPSTVSTSRVILHRGSVKESISIAVTVNQIAVRVNRELLPATTYTLTVTGVQGSGGEQLSSAVNIVFKTSDGIWKNAQTITTNGQYVQLNKIAFNKHSSTGMTIWSEYTAPRSDIFASRYSNGQWDVPQLVSINSQGQIFYASIAVGQDGAAVAVWQEYYRGYNNGSVSNRVWANEFTPASGWSTPQLIDDDSSLGSFSPEVAISPNGKAVAVWYQLIGGTQRIYSNEYTTTGGWAAARSIDAVSHSPGSANPQIAFDNKSNGYAIWSQRWQGKNMIWGNRYMADHGWIAPQIIPSNATASTLETKIAFDDSGNALLVWNGGDSLYAARYIRDQGWNPQVAITHSEQKVDLSLAVNGNGDAFISWTQLTPVGETTNGITRLTGTVWAARFTSANDWEAPVLLQFPNGYSTANTSLAIDEMGNAIAVWGGFNGTFNRIYANRYVAGIGWINRKVIDTTNTLGAYSPQIVMDAAGNALAIWQQASTTGATDIWFNRFE